MFQIDFELAKKTKNVLQENYHSSIGSPLFPCENIRYLQFYRSVKQLVERFCEIIRLQILYRNSSLKVYRI